MKSILTHTLPQFKTIYRKQTYIIHNYRTILNFVSNTIDHNPPNDANNEPVRLSTQYPPLPINERTNPKPSGQKIEPFKDLQFKPEKKDKPTTQSIPYDLDNNTADPQKTMASTPEQELSLGEYQIDPLELKKMIPHGTASREEIEEAIAIENAEWKGVHWSERNYTAKLGDIVNRQRPNEITRLMESSKPPVHKDGLNSIIPVQAGGVAYPIFYNPKGDNLDRSHLNIPKDMDGRKSRVNHIASLKKITGLNYSECAMEYDKSHRQYSITLEKLRNKQIDKLHDLSHKSKDQCKKIFDQCLGNFDKALRKLNR